MQINKVIIVASPTVGEESMQAGSFVKEWFPEVLDN